MLYKKGILIIFYKIISNWDIHKKTVLWHKLRAKIWRLWLLGSIWDFFYFRFWKLMPKRSQKCLQILGEVGGKARHKSQGKIWIILIFDVKKIEFSKLFYPGKQQWPRGIWTPIGHICAFQLVRVGLHYVQLVEKPV